MARREDEYWRLSESEAERLVRLYTDAELEILRAVEVATHRRAFGTATVLRGTLENVQAILRDLEAGSRQWCEEAIPRLYGESLRQADAQIKAAEKRLVAGFGAIHQQAVKVLADNAYGTLAGAAQIIGRRVEDDYRRAALAATRATVLGAGTTRQAARDFLGRLEQKGITSFQDKAGRNWNMKTYAEMVARTTTMEAHLQGTQNRLVEHGVDLARVSDHLGECPRCRPWEGKILSVTGATEGFPTVEEAKAAGLFHPRCRHALSAVFDIDAEIRRLEREPDSVRPEQKLPGFEAASIPTEKLTQYALNKEHARGRDKAVAFEKALGYNIDNYQDLMSDILANLGSFPAALKGSNQYGKKYEVAMTLVGPNGKTAKVVTAWLVNTEGGARLVSMYVKG